MDVTEPITEDFITLDMNKYHFQNQAPGWWREPLMGPAFPTGHKPAPKVGRIFFSHTYFALFVKEMRRPGCNGGVCYCNKEDYCNDTKSVCRDNINAIMRGILRCDVLEIPEVRPVSS